MNEVTCFTLWMLLYPVVNLLISMHHDRAGRVISWKNRSVAALIELAIWATVGFLLYRLI